MSGFSDSLNAFIQVWNTNQAGRNNKIVFNKMAIHQK